MSREGKLVKSTGILAVGTFFPKLAIFIALPILTSSLNKTEYGIYEMTITLVALILPVATVQIQAAAFRFLIDVRRDREKTKEIITNIYSFVLITSLIALFIAYIVLIILKQSLLIRCGICAYYLFDILSNVSRQIVRGVGRNQDYAISSVISGLGQILLLFTAVICFKWGLAGCLFALALSEFLSMAFLFLRGGILGQIDPRLIDRAVILEMLRYSWPMVPNSLSQWVIHASDRLVISGFLGIAASGVYSVAYKIPSILSLAQTTFNMAWQENASIVRNDSDVSAYYSSMFAWLLNIVAGMMAALIGMTPILFRIFVRGDYWEAYNQIPLLFMGMFFLCLSTFWGGIFVALKKTKEVGTTTVIAAVINLSVDLIMVKKIGLYAGSISSILAYAVMCLLRAVKTQKLMRIRYDLVHICVVGAVLVAQCIACFMRIPWLDLINLCCGLVFCICLNRKLILAMAKKVSAGLKRRKA